MTEYSTSSKAEVELLVQKDAEYIASLQSYIQNMTEYLPLRYRKSLYQNNKRSIKNASVIIYYINNLLTNTQTLGETYTSMKSSKIKNLIHMAYLLLMNSSLYSKAKMMYPTLIKRIKTLIKIAFNLFDFKLLQRSSLSGYSTSFPAIDNPFKLIGKLMIIKLCFVEGFNHLIKPRFFPSPSQELTKEVVYKNQECLLCYNDDIINPSVSTCGHIFCYECYIKWTSKSLNCPLCRNPTHPREIVLLRN